MEQVFSDKHRELLKLVSALVLRNEDMVFRNLVVCKKLGVTNDELLETISIATLVRGTIIKPLVLKVWEYWENNHKN